MVSEKDAAEILAWAEEHRIRVRLDGGWGVDALLGRQTRPHNDIDLFVERRQGEAFTALLERKGFRETGTPYTTPSHTVWRDGRGREIDLHLFEFDETGSLWFEGQRYPPETFGASGRIAGKSVACIPPAEQVLFHLGYEPDENDAHDVRLLCERFRVPVPEAYRKK